MLKKFLIALSLSNLCLYNIICILFYQRTFYVKNLPTAYSYLAFIFTELILASFFVLVWEAIKFINKSFLIKSAKAFLFILVILLLNDASRDLEGINHDLIKYGLITIMLLLIIFRKTTKATVLFLLISAPFTALIFVQSTTGFFINWNKPKTKPIISLNHVDKSASRVLWLIFDEMDYRLPFIEKPNNVKLPAFESFQKQALNSENAYPPSDLTKTSIPSLIDGKLISAAGNDTNNLYITYKDTGERVIWGSQPNVFSRAKSLGINTALIGEYLPYERLIGKDLSYCSWYSYYPEYTSSVDSFFANLYSQLFYTFTGPNKTYFHRKKIYPSFLEEAKTISCNSNYGLIMVHFPIPHHPFFYKTPWWKQNGEGYLNNLILADYTLEQIRNSMMAQGLWDKTNIIISADHCYRKKKRFFGIEDNRVPFMIKMAGQKEAYTFLPKFNTVISQDLVLAILKKEVNTPKETIQWLNKHIDQNIH